MPIVNRTMPNTLSQRMSLKAIRMLPARDTDIPPTMITFDLRISPKRAEMKQPIS